MDNDSKGQQEGGEDSSDTQEGRKQRSSHSFAESPLLVGLILTMLAAIIAMGAQIASLNARDSRDHEEALAEQLRPLSNFEEVIEGASRVIASANKSLYFAVDVPGYGAVTQPRGYSRYRDSLSGLVNSSACEVNAMWLSQRAESAYISDIERLTGREQEVAAQANSEIRRILVNKTIVDVELSQLSVHNFWVSRDEQDNYRSVVAWVVSVGESSTEVRGVYSESPDVGRLLVDVWRRWGRGRGRQDPVVQMLNSLVDAGVAPVPSSDAGAGEQGSSE